MSGGALIPNCWCDGTCWDNSPSDTHLQHEEETSEGFLSTQPMRRRLSVILMATIETLF